MTQDQTTLDGLPAHRSAPGQPGWELLVAILYHPDLRRVGQGLRMSAHAGSSWGLSRNSPVFPRAGGQPLPLADPGVSRAPIEVIVERDGLVLRPSRTDMRLRLDGDVVRGGARVPAAVLCQGVRLTLNERVVLWVQRVRERSLERGASELVGVSAAMEELRAAIHDVGRSTAPVLLHGATGVGKERVARALHEASPRRKGPFVAVNVAAIPAETAVSQLFGHARGAFTGAHEAHEGWFGQADGGTLFLDEIGDLPMPLQPMLLRALESGEVQPVGGRTRRVDVRVIAASDADLGRRIAERRFRDSLYFRLAQRAVDVPSLADRPADIPVLWAHFVAAALVAAGAGSRLISPGSVPWMPIGVIDRLMSHAWSGNVRELRAAAEAFAEANARREVAEIPVLASGVAASSAVPQPGPPVGDDLVDALEAHDWAILPTARALGISRNAVRRQMAERGIRRAKELTDAEIAEAMRSANGDVARAAELLRTSERALALRLR